MRALVGILFVILFIVFLIYLGYYYNPKPRGTAVTKSLNKTGEEINIVSVYNDRLSIKQIDSMRAVSNLYFTKQNAISSKKQDVKYYNL